MKKIKKIQIIIYLLDLHLIENTSTDNSQTFDLIDFLLYSKGKIKKNYNNCRCFIYINNIKFESSFCFSIVH